MAFHLKKSHRALVFFCLVLGLANLFYSQTPEENLIKDFKWRNIGPSNMIGRISDFEALESDFTQVLVASASGGVWKSVNAGTTWEPIFDKYGSASIGDVAFFQKDPKIIWVGTGEECCRNSIAWGDGIYKSVDGGKTFTHMGLKSTHTIARVSPILPIRTPFTRPPPGTHGVTQETAACSRPKMVERPGRN